MKHIDKETKGTGVEQLEKAAVELRELGDHIRGNGGPKDAKNKSEKSLQTWDANCGTEAVKQLRQLADAVKSNAVEQRALLLGSIEALLAGADILSCDCIETLRAERDVLSGRTQSQQIEDEDRRRRITFDDCALEVEQVEAILDKWLPDKQAAILAYALERLPEKEAAWEAESVRDEARDQLLNYLHNNHAMADQTAIYQVTLEAVKKDKGVVELKRAS